MVLFDYYKIIDRALQLSLLYSIGLAPIDLRMACYEVKKKAALYE